MSKPNRIFSALLLLSAGAFPADSRDAVSIPNVTPQFSSTPAPHNWSSEPPTFILTPAADSGRTGKVWVRKADRGLVIAGHVEGVAPQFPSSAADLMTKDHVEIWLSVAPNPEMPVMGWGNQFGDNEFPQGEESCAGQTTTGDARAAEDVQKCRTWVREQKSYRVQLRRLFTRQWQLAPGIAVESFATPAYQSIVPRQGKDKDGRPATLKPQGQPEFVAKATPNGGYDFEALIPWNAFPPSSQAALQDMFILVDSFNPASAGRKNGPYSTTAPRRQYGEASSFNRVHLNEPRTYKLTACDYPIEGLDFFSTKLAAYFMPATSTDISETLLLENYRGGYAYDPTGPSPRITQTHFYVKELGPGEHMCGPLLRYFKSGKGSDLRQRREKAEVPVVVPEADMGWRRLPDGTLLVRDGPREGGSLYGSGECGACPWPSLDIYRVEQNGSVTSLASISDIVGNKLDDMDIQLSPDWSRIAVYRHTSEQNVWTDEYLCLKGTYQKCAGPLHAPPPKPRGIKSSDR